MTITQHISIDLQQPGSAPVVHAVQGEEYTREVKVTLYSGGVSWTPPSGCEVAIRYGKPDGKGGIYDKLPDNTTAWSILNNTISITLAPQMLTVAGIVNAQVEIIVNEKEILSTFHFIVDVEEDASMGAVKSENYTNWKSFWFPQTTGAKAGQYVKVTRVDSDGHVLAVSPTNEPNETNQLATNAKNTAESANSKAEQATTLANKAQSTADSALAKANSALPGDSLPDVINDALAQAKESGEFDGEDGKNGSNGLSILAVNITAGNAQKIVVSADNVIENGYMLSPRDILIGDKVLTEDGKIFIVDSWNFSVDTSGGGSMAYNATFFADAGSGIKSVNGVIPDENGNVEVEIPEGSSDVYVGADEPTDPDIQIWINPEEVVPDVNYVKSVNGIAPDENGNVEIPVSGGSVDLTGYATEQFVQDGFQPKGNYLTEHQSLADYAKKTEIPTTLPASDVPAWAKQPQKPTYTAAEVGALPDTTKIPSTAEDVGALPANAFIPKSATDVGAIPVPETATVGQTVVVKAVDENGKPTEWEAVDLPAGGSSGNYVLLNDFTAREVANSVDITQTDDGTPYNLRAVYLEVGFASVEKEYASVVYSDNNISATVHNSVHTGRTANFKVSERYGMNQAEYWWSAPPQMGMKHEYNTSIPYAAYSEPFQNITGIKLSTDQQVKFKIKIWGVVA